MADEMWALVFDRSRDDWDSSKGFRKQLVAKPTLREAEDPLDSENVIVKVLYTGVCGSDRGIWFRDSFKTMIFE